MTASRADIGSVVASLENAIAKRKEVSVTAAFAQPKMLGFKRMRRKATHQQQPMDESVKSVESLGANHAWADPIGDIEAEPAEQGGDIVVRYWQINDLYNRMV